MRHLSFWGKFEEKCKLEIGHNSTDKTVTEAREEPDQDKSYLVSGTKTITKTREEPEQSPPHGGYSAIPVGVKAQTHTFSREETDQDTSNEKFKVFPS